MPYVKIFVSDEDRVTLLRWAQEQENEAAELMQRKPKRITLTAAVTDCYLEGLADLEVRQ